MRPFTRHGCIITVTLHALEADMLKDLAGQLTVLLGERALTHPVDAGSSAALLAQLGIGGKTTAPLDPALARLLPDAYSNDADASSEHRHLTELGLVDRKIANAHTVVATLSADPVELDGTASQSWLRALTDLRLTLAARLQIKEDGGYGTGDTAMLDVYEWLGYLQGMLLEEIESGEVSDDGR